MRISKITKNQFAIFGVSFLAITIITGLSNSAFAEPKEKIVICHIGEFGLETLSVSGNAEAAHLAHGDTLGACTDVPPPAPTLLTPVDDAVIDRSTTPFVHFSWSEVFDDDGIDFYNLVVRDGENQVVYNINTNDDDDDSDMSNFPVDGGYTWNVRATDNNANQGPFAATSFSFEIVTDNTPPPAPTLLSPADDAVICRGDSATILFEWTEPFDESGIDHYELRVLDGEGQVVYTVINDNTDDNDPSIANFPVDDEYFWNVRATDGSGNEGPFAAVSNSFNIFTVC